MLIGGVGSAPPFGSVEVLLVCCTAPVRPLRSAARALLGLARASALGLLPLPLSAWAAEPAAPAAPVTAGLPAAEAPPAAPAPLARGMLSHTLQNGLKVTVYTDPDMPLVATQTWVGVGSAHEAPNEAGFAHLFEHLMFGETKTYPSDAYSRHHTIYGGSENAYTSFDNTVYISLIAPEAHDQVLVFEADRLQNLVLDADNLANEQRIVTEELRLRTENDPTARLIGPALKGLFGEHPYGHSPAGTRADIARADLSLVQKFYAGYYQPKNLHLVIVGPVDGEATLARAEALFGAIQKPAIEPPAVPPLRGWTFPERVELAEDLPPIKVAALVYPGPRAVDPDYAATRLLTELLAGGELDRFREALVKDRKKALEAMSVPFELKSGSVLGFASISLPWRGERAAFRHIEAALADLDGGDWLSQANLDTARRRLLRGAYAGATYAESRAEALGQAWSWQGDLAPGLDDGAAALQAVTLDEVKAVWKKSVMQAKPVKVWAHKGPAQPIPEGPVAAASTAPKAEAEAAPPKLPLAPAGPPLALAPPVEWAVDAGTGVIFVEDHRAPLVELRLTLPAGEASPWTQNNGAGLAWTLQHYDTAGALRARADALAVELDFSWSEDTAGLSLSCLKQDLPAALALLGDILKNADYDADELKRARQGELIGWKGAQKDPDFRQEQAILETLYQEGDSRRDAAEAPSGARFKPDALGPARDRLLRLPGRTIGLAGDLSRAEAEALAAALLPPTEAAPEGLAPPLLPLPSRPPQVDVQMANLTQVYFAMSREGLTYGDPNMAAFRISQHILGGHFYSRLYVALRHEGGQTYGARADGPLSTSPAPFSLTTFTRAEHRAETEAKLRQTLARFHAEGVTQEELDEAVRNYAGAARLGLQSPGQRLAGAMANRAVGQPLDLRAQITASAEALTLEQINAFIRDFYDPAKFTLITVGPKG